MTNQRSKNSKSTSAGNTTILYKNSPIAEDCRNFGELEQSDNDPLLNCCSSEKFEEQKESTFKIKRALHEKLCKKPSVQINQDSLLNDPPVTSSGSASPDGYSPDPVLEPGDLHSLSVSTNSPAESFSEEQTTLQDSVVMSLGLPMACAATTLTNSISPLDITMHHAHEQCYPGLMEVRPHQILAGQSEQELLQGAGLHHQPQGQTSYPVSSCQSTNYASNGFIYPITPPQINHSPPSNEIMERYLHQQQQQQQQQQYHTEQSPSYGYYGVNIKENYAMKSPDSGYQEPCLSPTDQINMVRSQLFFFFGVLLNKKLCEQVGDR